MRGLPLVMRAATPLREHGSPPARNRLLRALPDAASAALAPRLELVQLDQYHICFRPDQPIESVFFPETAVVSFVSTFEDGRNVEVGTAGCEGMAGLPLFLGVRTSAVSGF